MFSRIFAIFRARNLEFVRDRGSMSWNLLLPFGLMLGLSFVFGDEDRAEYTVGAMLNILPSNTVSITMHPNAKTAAMVVKYLVRSHLAIPAVAINPESGAAVRMTTCVGTEISPQIL